MLPFLPKDEPRTLFVRGMAKITLKKSILDVLLPFGLIEGIHWVPDKYLPNTEDKFTNAYVVFCDAKSAVAAYIGWDRFIFNRKTRMTWGRFRSMSARKSVRVHNISDLATEEDFRKVFQTVAKVMYVNIETSKRVIEWSLWRSQLWHVPQESWSCTGRGSRESKSQYSNVRETTRSSQVLVRNWRRNVLRRGRPKINWCWWMRPR